MATAERRVITLFTTATAATSTAADATWPYIFGNAISSGVLS
jgi:hypothetical protein